jgi:hypothetical protein
MKWAGNIACTLEMKIGNNKMVARYAYQHRNCKYQRRLSLISHRHRDNELWPVLLQHFRCNASVKGIQALMDKEVQYYQKRGGYGITCFRYAVQLCRSRHAVECIVRLAV